MKFSILILIFLLTLFKTVHPAKILFYMGFSSYSQRISVWPLVEELTERGHNVTFLSGHPSKEPNPKVVDIAPKAVTEFIESGENRALDFLVTGDNSVEWEYLPGLSRTVCELMLKSAEVKELVKTTKFDLVFVDVMFNECGLAIAYASKAKTISFSTTTVFMWTSEVMGNIPETSWIPDMSVTGWHEPMTFMERVHNTLIPIYWHFWVRGQNHLPQLEEFIRKELDIPGMPSLRELENDQRLTFLTTHFSLEYARSLPPNYISIGGMSIVESNNVLPKEMDKFVDESGLGGVILISFGSYAKSSKLPPEIISVFSEVFGSFNETRFIWKFDIARPEGFPKNIMTSKWVPQQELLAHKKVIGFITHGGLGSTQEATYYGVPLIVFPLFAEQDYNANLIQKRGCGIKLNIAGIKKHELSDAISAILNDKRYRTNMAEMSSLFKDRPMTALQTAVWWTEYVMRHDDMSSLRPLAVHQTWYQRRLLDVWLFLFSSVFLCVSTIIYIIFKLFCANGHPKLDPKTKTS